MFEPSRNMFSCYIAGFQFYDGAFVLSELKAGDAIDMTPEPDNPHDPEAVVLGYRGVKLGYMPADKAGLLSTLAFYGHADVFECRVLQVAPEKDPWKQVRIGLFVRDARQK